MNPILEDPTPNYTADSCIDWPDFPDIATEEPAVGPVLLLTSLLLKSVRLLLRRALLQGLC